MAASDSDNNSENIEDDAQEELIQPDKIEKTLQKFMVGLSSRNQSAQVPKRLPTEQNNLLCQQLRDFGQIYQKYMAQEETTPK